MSPEANSRWQSKVREMLCKGLGVEDIALILGCSKIAIRTEIHILRESGELKKMFTRERHERHGR